LFSSVLVCYIITVHFIFLMAHWYTWRKTNERKRH